MKPAIGQLSYIGENAEFVAAGMDTDAVAKLFGDLCVSGKFHPESVNITDIINAFLELPAESRRQASKNHRPSLQLATKKCAAGLVSVSVSSIDTSSATGCGLLAMMSW